MQDPSVLSTKIRAFLGMIRGVRSAEIRYDDDGCVCEIEIEVAEGESEHRVVRDIESALATGLGMRLDHRAIRVREEGVVAVNGGGPEGSVASAAVRAGNGSGRAPNGSARKLQAPTASRLSEPGARRPSLWRVVCRPDGERYCEVTVELVVDGEPRSGMVRDVDTEPTRTLAAARATLEALADPARDPAMAVEGVEEFVIADEPALLASVRVRSGRLRRSFMGAALLEGRPLEASARAVLDAVNRFWTVRDEIES